MVDVEAMAAAILLNRLRLFTFLFSCEAEAPLSLLASWTDMHIGAP